MYISVNLLGFSTNGPSGSTTVYSTRTASNSKAPSLPTPSNHIQYSIPAYGGSIGDGSNSTSASAEGAAVGPGSSSGGGCSISTSNAAMALRRALDETSTGAIIRSFVGTAKSAPPHPATTTTTTGTITTSSTSSTTSITTSSNMGTSCEVDVYVHVVMADSPVRQNLEDGVPLQLWR